MKNLVGIVDTALNFPDSEMESEFGLKHKDGEASNPSFSTDVSDEEDFSSGEEDEETGKKRKHEDSPKTKDQLDRRRERNRVLARKTRLRKKSFFETLQKQVAQLAIENDMLKGIVRQRLGGSKNVSSVQNAPLASAEVALSTSRATAILEHADDSVMTAIQAAQRSYTITDPALPDNPIIFASKGFLDLSGYSLENILGRNCRFLQGPGTDFSQVAVLKEGIKAGVDTSVCLLNYRADGTPFFNQIFTAAIRDPSGAIMNYVGVQVEIKSLLDPNSCIDIEDLGINKVPKKGRPRTRELKEPKIPKNKDPKAMKEPKEVKVKAPSASNSPKRPNAKKSLGVHLQSELFLSQGSSVDFHGNQGNQDKEYQSKEDEDLEEVREVLRVIKTERGLPREIPEGFLERKVVESAESSEIDQKNKHINNVTNNNSTNISPKNNNVKNNNTDNRDAKNNNNKNDSDSVGAAAKGKKMITVETISSLHGLKSFSAFTSVQSSHNASHNASASNVLLGHVGRSMSSNTLISITTDEIMKSTLQPLNDENLRILRRSGCDGAEVSESSLRTSEMNISTGDLSTGSMTSANGGLSNQIIDELFFMFDRGDEEEGEDEDYSFQFGGEEARNTRGNNGDNDNDNGLLVDSELSGGLGEDDVNWNF